jgi:hypothetical protein
LEVAMKKSKLTESTMKKIAFTAAISTALLFALATGMATVPTPSHSPPNYVFGHYGSIPQVW